MKTIFRIILLVVLIILAIAIYSFARKTSPVVNPPVGQTQATSTLEVQVTSLTPDSLVESPLVVKGMARGTWYFEASFPIRLFDGNGKEIAVIPAQAQGEWMTTEFVPFEATLVFQTPTTTIGTLILEKDNPSGLPEYSKSISIPVRFK